MKNSIWDFPWQRNIGILETFQLVIGKVRLTRNAQCPGLQIEFCQKVSTVLEFYIPGLLLMKLRHCCVVLCFLSADCCQCFQFLFSFLYFRLCSQGRKVHSHRPLPSLGPAGGELPRQAALAAEEPVQAAHGSQSPASPDWHSVRAPDRRKGGEFCATSHNYSHDCFPPSFL